jgi:hypothetical protein
MRQLSGLEIDEYKTFQDEVIENEVNVKLGRFCTDPELAPDKRKPFSQLQEKLLKFIDKRLLKVPFEIKRRSRNVRNTST